LNTNKKLFDVVYCFDTNFNKQAFASISSLLDNLSEKIDIHILHNDLTTIKKLPDYIADHQNLSEIYMYEFLHSDIVFPNLETSHVSEATYYRLFIGEYIETNAKYIVYIDADMICISNPVDSVKKVINNMESTRFPIAAKTEIIRKLDDDELEKHMQSSFFKKYWPFERLPINDKYFNAGFMIINLENWKKEKMFNKLIDSMKKIKNEIVAWDQDVLNSVINGKYLELDSNFNFFSRHYNGQDDIIFLHYYGSKKPWTTDGIFLNSSEFYHENFRKVFRNRYHITHSWKKNSLKQILAAVVNFELFRLKYPVVYLREFINSLFINSKDM
jgi:lipopolysaccharide biosynthesis glycosyltransferase